MRRENRPRLPLWKPTAERKRDANLTRFTAILNQTHGLNISSYSQLHTWSVSEIADFWAVLWDFVDMRASRQYEGVVADLSKFPGTEWFPGARLNFAENL